jgi:integrase
MSFAHWQTAENAMRKYILPAFGKLDCRDVRTSHLDDLKGALLDMGRAPNSVKTWISNAGAFLNWLAYRGTIPTAPRTPTVRVPYRETGWINRKGQEEILAKIAPRHRLIFSLLIESGMRMGEACALRVRDIADGEVAISRALDGQGRAKETKTGRIRYVTVSLPLYAALEAHAKGRFGEEYLFRNRQGGPYRSRGLWAIWTPAARAAGLPVPPRIGMRHSRASQIRRRREEETYRIVSEQLGNTPEVAKGYARPRREERTRERE